MNQATDFGGFFHAPIQLLRLHTTQDTPLEVRLKYAVMLNGFRKTEDTACPILLKIRGLFRDPNHDLITRTGLETRSRLAIQE